MKKGFILIFVIALFILSACSNSFDATKKAETLLNKNWSEIEKESMNKTVRMYMWGGDTGINQYIDEWVAPRLKSDHGITLKRVPMDAPEFLKKLANEKRADQDKGNMDIIWINGENFKNAKENGLLFGPFANKLPNVNKYVDTKDLNVQYDFGTEVENMEAPWGKVQFAYQYDEAKVTNPPQTFEELKTWVKDNPGKFTYPDPTDFTGNAFLRQLFYVSVGDVKNILDTGYDESYANKNSTYMWEYLNEIKPYLWRQGKTYPNDLTELDRLFSKGEVYLTMGYNEARAEKLIEKNIFPRTTKSFVMKSGSLGNTHFLAIPYNSPNKAGAMTTINFLLSPDAQLTKLQSTYWGENMSLDPNKLSKKDQQKLKSIDRGNSVLPAETLKQYLQPEVDAQYVTWLKENWIHEVVQKK
ncbi:ABC transporter substrate-binding protein [Fictibacillus nanhaiensis]|uniref:ABC transporter substrate-binding protein n=1 Tax=Fictibacillus nanhaiensis TaxID=742169 RepID=UPI001C97A430|nr:ABC transporter substrate-binding protein [Fictibacillus nanhaiensis]MBY6035800.1 ABC transporter substrate-binding protein [Fictibacillus nanhaiensis]